MGTLKPTTPLRAHEQQPLKPPSPLLAPNQGTTETDDTSAPEKCTKNAHFSPAKAMAVSGEAQPAPAKATVVSIPLEHERAKAMAVSTPHEYQRAKATAVSDNRAAWSAEPDHSARGWRRGMAGQRADAPNHQSAHPAPLVWRAPEGQAAVPVGGGGAWPGNTQRPRPIGGRREACGAWPGFEPTRRAKLAARTASGRAGRAAAGDLSGHKQQARIQKRPPGTGWAYLSRLWESNPRPIHYE